MSDDNIFDTELPLLSHLTYDELHAMLLGVFGLPMGAGLVGGADELSIVFTVTIFSYVMGVKALPTRNSVPAALHAMVNEAWYFAVSYAFCFVVGAMIFRHYFPPPEAVTIFS